VDHAKACFCAAVTPVGLRSDSGSYRRSDSADGRSHYSTIVRSLGFGDGGSFFLVGKTTGIVTIVRTGESAQVEPDRKPPPKPTPVAEFKPVAAFLFFDSKNFTVAQATIKNDVSLREAASRLGVPLYSVFSDEAEFAGPTWQSAIGQTGTPCLVLLDKANKPKTVKIQTVADVLEALK
jgi:hypothetical protein